MQFTITIVAAGRPAAKLENVLAFAAKQAGALKASGFPMVTAQVGTCNDDGSNCMSPVQAYPPVPKPKP